MRFTDQSIIVTGAGSGIGRAAALLFAAEGGRIVVADVTDVTFTNAGISGGMATIFDTDVALINEVLRVNLIGLYLMVKHAAPRIAERAKEIGRDGAIVLTASVAGIRSGAGSPAYSASKAGVINLAMVSAQQLSGSNVRVNAICPGPTETGMTKPTFDYARDAGKLDRVGRLNPLRWGAKPRSWPRSRCSSPPLTPATSTARRSRSTAGCRRAHPVTKRYYGRTAA